jgi:flagellar protein FliS
MYNTTLAKRNSNRINHYLVKEILESTPQQLIIKIYDFAILNCQRKNLAKTNSALQELINSLRWDGEGVSEISAGLQSLYQYCQDEMRNKNYDIVFKILTELRESWLIAFNM